MGKSVLVFISHSSEDKESLIEPIVADLEDCYINVWIDKRKILPGDNLRKSIFKDGLDKADIALIFFTQKSLKSSWVDREIKHVLREEVKKGNNFDLNKIISIFDSKETYDEIADRYPELTDDLLHLMPVNYTKTHLGQLISAIWSKYLTLQGGDVENQRQLLAKEKQIFKLEQDVQKLHTQVQDLKSKNSNSQIFDEFREYYDSGQIDDFIKNSDEFLSGRWIDFNKITNLSSAIAFGLLTSNKSSVASLSDKGREFFKWIILNGLKK
jgi:hypothetical protein